MGKFKGVKSAKISLTFQAASVGGSRDFKNVQELAVFLKNEPEIAKLVGYIHKVKPTDV